LEKDKIDTVCKALFIGGSAGSLEVILSLLPKLKPGLKFPLIIVLHRKNAADSLLSELLAYKTTSRVKEVEDKDPILNGVIYIAPADYHVLIERENYFSLDDSEKVNYSRPSIDVTFESAAEIYTDKLVCILLSGANEDGVTGLKIVKENKGLIIVQNPLTAEVPFMPEHAISHGLADLILTPDEIVSFINLL
jgi:two-component system chemotaxis response regulator CheB